MALRPLPESLLNRPDIWLGEKATRIAGESSGYAALDALLPGAGWPRGTISELLIPRPGVGEFGLMLPLLVRQSQMGRRVVFVGPPHIPYAPALARAGVALQQFWVIEPPATADRVWAVEQILRCAGTGVVVGWLDTAEERVQRRLQLAAEQNGDGVVGLLMRPEKALRQPSVAALRLALRPEPTGTRIEILKSRGGRVGQSLRLGPHPAFSTGARAAGG